MLEEIFKTNPELLKEPEVQALIKHVEDTYKTNLSLLLGYKDCHDEILRLIVHSEICLKKGMSAKETLDKIEEAICKY